MQSKSKITYAVSQSSENAIEVKNNTCSITNSQITEKVQYNGIEVNSNIL